MRLKLIKIEEGICSGEVLFHKYGENDKANVTLMVNGIAMCEIIRKSKIKTNREKNQLV